MKAAVPFCTEQERGYFHVNAKDSGLELALLINPLAMPQTLLISAESRIATVRELLDCLANHSEVSRLTSVLWPMVEEIDLLVCAARKSLPLAPSALQDHGTKGGAS